MNKETFNAEAQSTQRTAEKELKNYFPSPLVLLCVLCASALNDLTAFDLCSHFLQAF